jgi:hypothetical protein
MKSRRRTVVPYNKTEPYYVWQAKDEENRYGGQYHNEEGPAMKWHPMNREGCTWVIRGRVLIRDKY